MNQHVKPTNRVSADLSRRSFLVGSAAAGLMLGYSGGIDQALAAPSNFDPSVWYSISPDGLVTVTCGKADMGQHIASTMAQLVSEELESSWKDMNIVLASNDPKFNDPILGAQVTGHPVTFLAGGKQFVAVSTGRSNLTGSLARLTPDVSPADSPNKLFVFALP